MEELSAVHCYAAASLFALALNQSQIQRQSWIPVQNLISDRGADLSPNLSEDEVFPWSSEECGLLHQIFTYLKIDPQAWPGIEITATYPNAKDHIAPCIRILQEDDAAERPVESVAALANGVDAMSLILDESSSSSSSPSNPSQTSVQRWASMKKPLVDRQSGSNDAGTSSSLSSPTQTLKQRWEAMQMQLDRKSSSHGVKGSETTHGEAERRTLIKQRKVAVLCELLTACVTDSGEQRVVRARYDARQRVAFRLLALWLDVEWEKVAASELMLAYMALAAEEEFKNEHQGAGQISSSTQQWKRSSMIRAAAFTGGAVMAVTGGLAAPAIAAGLTALAPAILGVGGVATAMGSTAGSVAIAASFGAAGARIAGTKMARRTGDVEEFLFLPVGDNHQQGRLAAAIVVSGIILEADEDFTKPWEYMPDLDMEWYALRWETKELVAVSTAIQDWLTSSAAMELVKAGAMMTVLSGLLAAIAWPTTLLAASDFIDSKWNIAIDRSDKAGELLAKCLLAGSQGNRPVTLMGFSLGARVIFSCLEYLATIQDDDRAAGSIVERVVLLGAPITLDQQRWKNVRRVVASRFINAYSTNDWILGLIYRASFFTQGLAGLQIVEVPGIENIDVTQVVNGHSMYLTRTSEILQNLDLNSFYPVYPSKLYPASE